MGGGYRLGAGPEEASAYVAGERRAANSQQDVSLLVNGTGLVCSLVCVCVCVHLDVVA